MGVNIRVKNGWGFFYNVCKMGKLNVVVLLELVWVRLMIFLFFKVWGIVLVWIFEGFLKFIEVYVWYNFGLILRLVNVLLCDVLGVFGLEGVGEGEWNGDLGWDIVVDFCEDRLDIVFKLFVFVIDV